MNVALVVMPFAAITRPSLAVGLLQANLQRVGIACEAVYANLVLGEMLGTSAYRRFSSEAAITTLAGEWTFSQVFHGPRFSNWDSYREDVLNDPVWGASDERHQEIQALLALAPAFLDRVFASRQWGDYDLVGFSSTFEQTMPSLCLARMIREHYPATLIAMGGANFEAAMGRPYLDHFDFLDFVCKGEADTSFARLCSSLRDFKAGRTSAVAVPQGFLFRDEGTRRSQATDPTPPVDLESSPTPAYDDYFRAVRAGPAGADSAQQWLPVEASRGCWWGEKVHCTFCGLNGDTMRFRAKSARRVIEETDELVARHGTRRLQFADNILSMDYFADLLPAWAERGDGTARFFEIKSNLTRDQLALLQRAGVSAVQAGIESLSDHTLRIMGKGVSAAQNIALLRWCAELGIDPLWNLIYGFPGERLADYAPMLDLLRHMVHLSPPDAVAPIRMDRFSPNFTDWQARGFTSIAPMPAYGHVFPFGPKDLAQIAYYFRYNHPQVEQARRAGAEVERFVAEWLHTHQHGETGGLLVEQRGDGLVLNDTRYTREAISIDLDRSALALLMACDRPASRATALARAIRSSHLAEADAISALSALLAQHAIVQAGSLLVTVACLPESVRAIAAGEQGSSFSWPVMLTSCAVSEGVL